MDSIRREYVSLWSWASERHEREQIATMLDTVRALSDAQLTNEDPESIEDLVGEDLLAGPDASTIEHLSLDGGRAA